MRRLFKVSGVLAVLVGLLPAGHRDAHAQPNRGPVTIMLIRHAEDIGVSGVDLSPRGYKRAEALPGLFSSRLPKPDVIIATHASKASNRPIETVEPLSRQLHVPIEDQFRDNDYRARACAADRCALCRQSGPHLLAPWQDSEFGKGYRCDRRATLARFAIRSRLGD